MTKDLPTPYCVPALHAKYRGACYHCCETCDADAHRCHFCGDFLAHDGSRWTDKPGTSNPCYVDAIFEERLEHQTFIAVACDADFRKTNSRAAKLADGVNVTDLIR